MRFSLALGLVVLLTVVAPPAGHAQSADDDLGYVIPQVVEGWCDEPPTVEVNLSGTLLKMATQTTDETAEEDDPGQEQATALMKRLSAIHVRIFENADASMDALETRTTELTERLGQRGWETVARIREPDEQVSVQLRPRGEDTVAGLVVLVNDGEDDESIFVNIVGDISPEELGQLTGSIDGLDDLGDLGSDSSDENGGEDDS
jgi:hypothetical protein